MSRDVLEIGAAYAARCTLQHLCREIVRNEARAHIYRRTGFWLRGESTDVYVERLRTWHYAWVRGAEMHLERCSVCGRVQIPIAGYSTCAGCGATWLSRV